MQKSRQVGIKYGSRHAGSLAGLLMAFFLYLFMYLQIFSVVGVGDGSLMAAWNRDMLQVATFKLTGPDIITHKPNTQNTLFTRQG